MKRVKVTVLKTTLDKELAKEYGAPGLTACPMHQAGQVFYADYAKPDGFCDEAWKAIYQYVFALSHGADGGLFYYGDWIRKPGVAICSCNDGIRPVIFKLETTDEESTINYTPVPQAATYYIDDEFRKSDFRCQSCGMPMHSVDQFGTNKDGSLNHEYCCYCYREGVFLQDCTMDAMIEHCVKYLDEFNGACDTKFSKEEAVTQMREDFPKLKRWTTKD